MTNITAAPQITTIEQDKIAAEQAAAALRAAGKRNVNTRTVGQDDYQAAQVTVGTRIVINIQNGKFVTMRRNGRTWREYAVATKVENVVRHVLNIR